MLSRDWPSNCQQLPACEILSPAAVANKLAVYLRTAERCDLVIALTHMRLAEDLEVSRATFPNVDLLLGGHDHDVVRRTIRDTNCDPSILHEGMDHSGQAITEFEGPVRIIKSGTDWRGLSIVRIKMQPGVDHGRGSVASVKGE